MKRSVVPLLIIGLSACHSASDPKADTPPPRRVDDPVPGGVGETLMMPAWEEMIQHTRISAPGKAMQPSASRDGKRFVYASTETSSNSQIFLRATDGVTPTRLTNNNATNLFPRLSPDGSRVAFASDISGNWDIYILRVDAPATWMQVTSSPCDDIGPSWSPDGQRLVYGSKTAAGFWQLVIVDIATGIPTFLGPGMNPDWSPHPKKDEQWIAFQSQPRGAEKCSLWIVRPDGSDLQEIVADRHKDWSAIQPRWSTDGAWIAYATVRRSIESKTYGEEGEADDIWIVRPDGRFDTRLTDEIAAEWWPAWGGDRLFFASRRDGFQNIYSVRPKPLDE